MVMGNTHSAISAGDLQEYLESNKISEIVQEAVNALSKERPEKPLAFLADYLNKKQAEADAPKKKNKGPDRSEIIFEIYPEGPEEVDVFESKVREVQLESLEWGEGKLEDLAFGIKKLIIGCRFENDKVGVDALKEKIEAVEEVQSAEVIAFNMA